MRTPLIAILDAPEDVFDVTLEARRRTALAVEYRVQVTLRADASVEAAVRVTLGLEGASEPWWLIPGLFYGENRPAGNARRYPRFEIGARGEDAHARLVSDEWHFRGDRAAAPVVFAWPHDGGDGVALSAAPETEAGLTGIGFSHDGETALVALTFPAQEGPVTYYGDETPREALVARHRFAPGETFETTVTVHAVGADRQDSARVLRELHARHAGSAPLRPWMSVERAADLAASGLLDWHYDPDPGVLLETVGFDRGVSGQDGKPVDRQAMHVGWVSGIPWAYAMLRHGLRVGDQAMLDAASRVIDFCTAELSPSGTLWGVWYRDRGWTQSWTRHRRGLHSRTLGEATHFLLRAAEAAGRDDWRRTALANLDVVVRRQREDGNVGSMHHAETGEVLSWSGTAGLAWAAALAEAARSDERWRAPAQRAGEYYASFVEADYLHGAPEDVDLAVTSEDGYVAVMAYMALFHLDGDDRWLRLAKRSADFALTFRYLYDVSFPAGTMLDVYDFGTRGADQASPSNQHLHSYGLVCTREFFQLAEATGDDHYRERAEETLACFRQFVARFDGDFNAYRGMVTERFYQTECFQPKGMLLTLSHAWSAGVLLLACEDDIERSRERPGRTPLER
ncbi:hypothetical protein M3147_13540 [Agromyces mediolanus]|uniref:hypothetical protein n=1 Tax=Agromyces mediolanus TaxID=41986 RepID=UPI00203D13F4|nr:hypothetical protein [Agromyces mediolanus]MCM3658272.1 hypothetical protein [Agromyces mediolanus]